MILRLLDPFPEGRGKEDRRRGGPVVSAAQRKRRGVLPEYYDLPMAVRDPGLPQETRARQMVARVPFFQQGLRRIKPHRSSCNVCADKSRMQGDARAREECPPNSYRTISFSRVRASRVICNSLRV